MEHSRAWKIALNFSEMVVTQNTKKVFDVDNHIRVDRKTITDIRKSLYK